LNRRDSSSPIERYFQAMEAALDGFNLFLSNNDSELYSHEIIGGTLSPYMEKLAATFSCWHHKIGFVERFRIDQADSGFPIFQNVLELEADRKGAEERLTNLKDHSALKADMIDHILSRKGFPEEQQENMAERAYLEHIQKGEIFNSLILPETIEVSINSETDRPSYHVHWGAFDGSRTLPIVYMAKIEDSSKAISDMLIGKDGKLRWFVKPAIRARI
jgi:hypothetical protein